MTFWISIMLIIVAFIGGGTIGILVMATLAMSKETEDEHASNPGAESYRGER